MKITPKQKEALTYFSAWQSTDEATAKEVWQDIREAISTCRQSEFSRLWFLTNANVHVLRIINYHLERAKDNLRQINVDISIYRCDSDKEEADFHWRAKKEGILTLIVRNEVANKFLLKV